MTGHEERHDLVADVLVRAPSRRALRALLTLTRLLFYIKRFEEQRERVAAVDAVAAPACDEIVDDRIEHMASAPKTARVPQRKPLTQRAHRREHCREFRHHQ